MNNPDQRKQFIKLIHIGKSKLGMDQDTYRVLLVNTTNKSSCSDMNGKELKMVLDSMVKRGFVISKKQNTDKHKMASQLSRIAKKIRAKWLEMHSQGIINDSSLTALNTYISKIAKNKDGQPIHFINWLNNDQAIRVLETLKKWQQRAGGGV